MNRLLIVATIAIMLVSCVQVEVVEPEVVLQEKSAIEFGAFVDKSSRAVETTLSTLAAAKVCAFYSGTDAWSTSSSRVQYMDAELSIDSESGEITCSPTSYWPGIASGDDDYGKLSFFSYSPIDENCVMSQVDGSQNIALEYSVDDDPAKQSDIVFAAEMDRTQGDLNPLVSLEYNHILSKISFSAFSSSSNAKVKSIKVIYSDDSSKLLASKGTYTHDVEAGKHSWASADVETYHHSGVTNDLSPDVDILLSTEPQEIVASQNYIMLLPQSAVDGAISVEVVYNNGGADITKVSELPAPEEGEFEMGIHYNYSLEVNNSNIVISDIIINPWDDMVEVHPFNIYTAEQLASIGHDPLYVNNGCYMIMNDIDVSDYINRRSNGSWKSLCADDPFTGEIVGQGFTITGITINEAEGTNQGLFAMTDGANIHDLNIGAPNITGGTNVGGLAGLITNTTIKDCSTEGGNIDGSSTVGGLIGSAEGSTISYGHNSATVTAKVDNEKSGIAGGIVGKSDNSTIIACYNRGELSGIKSIGGIAGEVSGSKLVTCYNTSAVTGFDTTGATVTRIADTRYFAGIAGSSASSQYISCYNTGRIKWARYGDVASGIVGENGGGNTLTECHHLIGSAKRKIATSKDAHSDAGFRLLKELNAKIPTMNERASDAGYGGYSSYSSDTYLPSVEPDIRVTMRDYVEANYQPVFDHYDLFKNVDVSLNYQVMNDIYGFKDVATIPLGQSSSKPFKGAFNGDNFTLYEFNIDKTWGAGASLFGYVNSSSTRAIENYKLSAPNIEGKDDSSSKRIGGFVSELYGGDVRNCHIVDGGRVYSHVNTCGGIVSYCSNANSSIIDCSNTATVKADNFAGGIVGVALQFKAISGCNNSANIHTTDDSCGGIVGEAHDENSTKRNGIITNCLNSGSIDSAKGGRVGGIVGSSYGTYISECVNRGARVYAADDCAAGILGYESIPLGNKPGYITNCGNHGYVRAAGNYAGGIVGRYNDDNFNFDTDVNSNDTVYDFADVSGYISGCYSSQTSNIEVGDDYVGGIVGACYAAVIQGCHNNGTVKSENKDNFFKDYSGGVAGLCDYVFVQCCYNSGTVINTMKDWSISGGVIARGDPAYLYGCYNSGKVSDGNTGWLYDYDGAVCGRNGGSETGCYYVKGVHSDGDGGSPVNDLAGLNSKIATMNSKDGSPYWFVKSSGNNVPHIMGPDGMVGEEAPYVKY